MRTTLKALLCSALATACAPIGERGNGDNDGPDAGVDAGSGSATCDSPETKNGDLVISSATGFNGLPTKCWKLTGKLTLSGTSITTLEKLGDLREVQDLVIDGTDLAKFNSKSPIEVTGDIAIRYNTKLSDLANITPKLGTKSITVEYNQALGNLGGLSKAVEVTGQTVIRNNNALTTIDLGRATRLAGGLTVSDNSALKTIDLHSLRSVGDAVLGHDFVVRNNPNLTSLSSLYALEFVHGNLIIDNNDALTTLEGTMMSSNYASRKVVVDYNVVITGNLLLQDTGGIAHLKYIGGGITISQNGQLTFCEIREIDCCVQTAGNWNVSGNKTNSCGQTGYSWCYPEFNGCPN
jgi:hypothetical protein